ALANLLDNAIKYNRPGGKVTLAAEQGGDAVLITVSDTGLGIPPEEKDKVWDRLYRGDKSRNEKGLGLGLSLVRAVVQAHGGTVEVSSEPGRGSVFTIRLPAARAAHVRSRVWERLELQTGGAGDGERPFRTMATPFT